MSEKKFDVWADVREAQDRIREARKDIDPSDIDTNWLNDFESAWEKLSELPHQFTDRTFGPFDVPPLLSSARV